MRRYTDTESALMLKSASKKQVTAQTVTLVIPCNHSEEELVILLRAVSKGTRLPNEILVVRSGLPRVEANTIRFYPLSFTNQLFDKSLRSLNKHIQVCDLVSAFPGKARNIGIKHARGALIAFLDVKTIPDKRWLELACESLKDPVIDGVWGSRVYEANSFLAKLIRDSIYGRRPVKTVAGSVFRKEVVSATGTMIPWVSAGEDGDWVNRVNAHRLSFVSPKNATHRYYGLDNKPLSFFIKKWWRYYHHSRMFSVNNRDRWSAQLLLYIILVFFAFNWNYKISEYIFGSPLVVPHVTKVAVILGPTIYVIIRGVYLPIKRKTPLMQVFPFRFMLLLLTAFILDLVKTAALLKPIRKNANLRSRSSQKATRMN